MNADRRLACGAILAGAFLLCCCRAASSGSAAPPLDVKEISAAEVGRWIQAGTPFVLIDVRQDEDWQARHAASAVHIRRVLLSDRIGTFVPDKRARIVLYCGSGKLSAFGAETLKGLGYVEAYSLSGGFRAWQEAGLPITH